MADPVSILEGKKVLLLKLRYIGDTLSLHPVIENLKEKVPRVRVDVMVNQGTEEILAHHPGITRLWVYERKRAKKGLISSAIYHKQFILSLRSEKYDFVIDFTHGDRAAFLSLMTGARERISYQNASALSHILMNRFVRSDPFKYHIVDYQLLSLRFLGLDGFDRGMKVYIPDATQAKVDRLLSGSGIEPDGLPVMIHPGSRGRLRQWRPERFGEIARRLKEVYPADVLLVGGPGEETLLEQAERHMGFRPAFRSTGLGLLEAAALLKRCRLFIGNDSAPGHIAAAVNCPSITLFGPTFPHMWRPLSPVGEVIFKNVPCCGCRQEICTRPDSNCMDLIEVDEVWEKVGKLLVAL
jgi:predicted lipopolysaccharide heptosyltransferase III